MRRAKHQTPTRHGTLAHIRIDGILYQKHFPHGTDPIDIKQWIVDQELDHRNPVAQKNSFAADAERYLTLVTSMTSYADRKRDIEAWIEVFKDTQRASITSVVISAQLQAWRQTLSASTCNHRRTALQHLWTRLDGKGAQNPVKEVPRFKEPEPAPLGIDYATIRKIFKQLPTGPDKARLMMLAYVGLPNSIIAQLTPESLDASSATLAVPGRKKGFGTQGRMLPLTSQGVAAMKMLIATKAFGPFSRYHLRWVLTKACETADVKVIRPYDLRHSFGTEVYRRSGDPESVQFLMQHASGAMTRRYTLAAVPARVRKALRGFGR
jgi:integrase